MVMIGLNPYIVLTNGKRLRRERSPVTFTTGRHFP
jgi:hypothetical protein